jgi:hypothetical protein
VLKIEKFFVFFIFPPLAYLSWCLVFPSKSSFSGEFLCPFFFSNLVFLVALDPSHFSFRRFFVGVCCIAESEGRAVDFGDLVPSGCVLRRLSKELFDLVFPALDTWKTVKDLMASEGNSWSLVRSEDLPEGLFDRDESGCSSEETPSVSSLSKVVVSEDSWIAQSYFSIVDVEGLEKYRRRYQIPDNVVLQIRDPDERACFVQIW